MSEIKTKRVNKSKEMLVDEMLNKKAEEFKAEVRALEDKYEFRLEPILNYSVRGIVPTINIVRVEKPKVE